MTYKWEIYSRWRFSEEPLDGWGADCGENLIVYDPSNTKEDCRLACKEAAKCRFASFRTKTKQCGLVPKSYDCKFLRKFDDEMILVISKKTYTEKEWIAFDGAEVMTKKGELVVDQTGVGRDQCIAVCDIHPRCRLAETSSSHRSAPTCNLRISASGKPKPQPTSFYVTNYGFIANWWFYNCRLHHQLSQITVIFEKIQIYRFHSCIKACKAYNRQRTSRIFWIL